MILDDLIITTTSSKRPICGVAALWIALLKQYLFALLAPHPQWLNGPTYDGPTYDDNGQAKCFQLTEPIKVLKQERSQSATKRR